MDTHHVEFVREDTPMTDVTSEDDTPTPTPTAAHIAPFIRREYPIVINTISTAESDDILSLVRENNTAGLSSLLNRLGRRDRALPGKILIQARDLQGRNALHIALTLRGDESLGMLTFLLHNSILPAVYPSLKRALATQTTTDGDNPALYACRLAKSYRVVRALMAAGSPLLGVRNGRGMDGLQCVVGPPVDEWWVDEREGGDLGAGARLVRDLVEGRLFGVGGLVPFGDCSGYAEVHIAARYDRVEELTAIVDMVGVGCLEVQNTEGLDPYDIAVFNEACGVVAYIGQLTTASTW